MSDERLLLLSALTATAALAGLSVMKQPVDLPDTWFEIVWPRDLETNGVTSFLRAVASDRSRSVVAFEVVGQSGALGYRIGLSKRTADATLAMLRSFIPSVVATPIADDLTAAPTYAWDICITNRNRQLRTADPEQIARALITTLATTKGETVVLQWLLGPRLAPSRIAATPTRPTESWGDALRLITTGIEKMSTEERKALQAKLSEAGFRAIGRVGVAGANEAATRGAATRILNALRLAESPGVQITLERSRAVAIASAAPGRKWPTTLSCVELAGLTAWPLGADSYPGIDRSGSTPLRALEGRGRTSGARVVMQSAYPGDDRALVLTPQDALQHLHILGPTGVGKSTLMLNLILQDIDAGRGVVVIDPKGDLATDVLARIPASRVGDVVVLDPADDSCPVGLNVLRSGGRSPELIADQVLAVFHGLYKDNWGPRLQDILHASLLTLAGRPGTTLCSVPLLLSNERYRSSVTASLNDEIALKPFWHWFNSLSEGERSAAIAPVMNKLRAFLLRPRMRGVIGQAEPRFEMSEVFASRKVVIVSLAKGLLGPEAAALLGSLVVSQVWQAALGQVRIPVERRPTVMLYADEFQEFLNLPTDIADVLAQSRGLGLGMTLAHQHLGQLSGSMRSAVLANARSRVCFQLSHDDARAIAGATSGLTSEDLQALPRFQAYASLVHGGASQPFASGVTTAPRARSIDPEVVRARSRETYGRPLADVEAQIDALMNGDEAPANKPSGRRRRT